MAKSQYDWSTLNNQENKNTLSASNLPKFSDTFLENNSSSFSSSSSSANKWGASTSGTQYETTTNVVLEKRFDWDGLVDKVFKDEKRKPFGDDISKK
jgi:hypothetical protein